MFRSVQRAVIHPSVSQLQLHGISAYLKKRILLRTSPKFLGRLGPPLSSLLFASFSRANLMSATSGPSDLSPPDAAALTATEEDVLD